MTYKSTILRSSFWFHESKKTAQYMLDGLTKKEIIEISINENAYQTTSIQRSKDIVSYTYNRLNVYPKEVLKILLKTDVTTAKIIVLISIMTYDQLFFEFMNEVYKEHILFGKNTLTPDDVDHFLKNKKNRSDIVFNWSKTIFPRLRSKYLSILRDADVLDNKNMIKIPFISFQVQELLKKNNFEKFLNIFII